MQDSPSIFSLGSNPEIYAKFRRRKQPGWKDFSLNPSESCFRVANCFRLHEVKNKTRCAFSIVVHKRSFDKSKTRLKC